MPQEVGQKPDRKGENPYRVSIRKPSWILSIIIFIFAGLSITAGALGYLYFDSIIKPNSSLFFCSIPAGIAAALLITLGIFLQKLRWRSIGPVEALPKGLSRENSNQINPINMTAEEREDLKIKLSAKIKELLGFLDNIKEQHDEELLSDNTYSALARDNMFRLRIFEGALQKLESIERNNGAKSSEKNK